MDWEEDNLFYNYNLAEVMVVKKVKAVKPISK